MHYRFLRHGGFNSRTLRASPIGSLLVAYQVFSSSSENRKECNGFVPLDSHITSLEGAVRRTTAIRPDTDNVTTEFDLRHPKKQQRPSTAKSNTNSSVDYDFVVVGYGNAGRSAVQTLQDKCPKAKIAVVDPLRSSVRGGGKNSSTSSSNKHLHHYRDTVIEFDPSSKTLRFLSDQDIVIEYKHAILIATGARGKFCLGYLYYMIDNVTVLLTQ